MVALVGYYGRKYKLKWTNKVARFQIEDLHLSRIVDAVEFQDLVNALDHKCVMPSRKYYYALCMNRFLKLNSD